MMGNYFGGGYGFGGFGFGFLFMILFWGLIIWAIIALVKTVSDNAKKSGGENEDTPMGILRERYAKGEVTKEQFDQMKKDLSR